MLFVLQVDLASMSAADLDAYAADLWLMAPPCQPFTRQGKQRGGADARSSSFLHLMQQLQLMQAQPSGLLVENVVGFQGSDVHTQLAAALTECGYHTQVGWACHCRYCCWHGCWCLLDGTCRFSCLPSAAADCNHGQHMESHRVLIIGTARGRSWVMHAAVVQEGMSALGKPGYRY
jgi:hypothetical protein